MAQRIISSDCHSSSVLRQIALLAAISVGAVAFVGCANNEGDGIFGAGGSTNAAGGAGGGGGGMGGSVIESACSEDCSLIETPPCLVAICNEGQEAGEIGTCVVVSDENGTSCDDGLFCTVNDACLEGVCTGLDQNDCGTPVPACTESICNEQSQSCSTIPAEDDVPCFSDDLCQINSVCSAGLCVGVQKDCFFSPFTECNNVSCNPSSGDCEPTPDPTKNGSVCFKGGDKCMVSKTCNNGDCNGGTPKDCSAAGGECTLGLCEPSDGSCYGEPIPPGASCAAATDDCNAGTCDVNGVCSGTPANEGGVCDDGNSCTITDICTAGACAGVPDPGYTVYFSETFASNSQGWTLGPEWAIGPAVAGPAGNCEDPGMDTTTTADNGIAGVAIGGCSPSSTTDTVHGMYYLTSPVFNTAGAPSIYLDFKRWLESDYTPFMNNVIEVYNGTAWVQIWQSGPSPGIHDAPTWMPISHNITAYANANMQIRFGFDIGSTGVFDEGSWSIDDVVVASGSCQ